MVLSVMAKTIVDEDGIEQVVKALREICIDTAAVDYSIDYEPETVEQNVIYEVLGHVDTPYSSKLTHLQLNISGDDHILLTRQEEEDIFQLYLVVMLAGEHILVVDQNKHVRDIYPHFLLGVLSRQQTTVWVVHPRVLVAVAMEWKVVGSEGVLEQIEPPEG